MEFFALGIAGLFSGITIYRFHWGLALFFALLPTYLIRFSIGPLPTTLLEVLLGILTLMWLYTFRTKIIDRIRFIFRKQPLHVWAVLLFVLAATLSVFTSIDTRAALGEWKAFYIEPIIVCIILATSITTKKQLHTILYALLATGFVTSLYAIYQHFTGFGVPEAFWQNRNTFRVTAWYGFPNGVGLFLAPLVPIALYLVKEYWKKLISIIPLLFIPFSVLAIFYAKSTGGLVGVLGGIGVLLLFYKKTRYWILGLGIIGLIGFILIPSTNPIKQELTLQDRSGQIRVHMWKETTEFLTDNPILGAGLASYTEKIEPYHTTVHGEGIEIFHHPHNIFLTMWVNLGLLGLIAFLWIVISIVTTHLSLYKHKRIPTRDLYILVMLCTILVMGLVDSPYIKNDWAIVFWMIPGLLIASYKVEHT